MSLKQNKERIAWLKSEIRHNEVLLKCSIKSSEDRSESLSNLFLAQAKRIEKTLLGLQTELNGLVKKKKTKKKKK